MNKKIYKMKIKSLSPIFIGSSSKYEVFDYIFDKNTNKIYLIDNRQIIKNFSDPGNAISYLNELHEVISKPSSNDDFQAKYIKLFKKYDIDYKSISYRTINNNSNRISKIESAIANNGNLYIPASTIKGAIINCIEANILYNSSEIKSKYINGISEDKSANRRLLNSLNNDLKNKSNKYNSISISDAFCDGNPLSSIVDVVEMRYKGSINTKPNKGYNNYEVIDKRQEFECTIDLTGCDGYNIETLKNDLIKAFALIKNNYLDTFQLDNLRNIPLPKDNEIPLLLGKHTGLVSKTYYYGLETNMFSIYKHITPKRRKTASKTVIKTVPSNIRLFKYGSEDYYLPGLCVIEFEELNYNEDL